MRKPAPRTSRSAFRVLHSALVLALMAVATATASAATYYASPTGAADAACTADDPGTVAAAIGKAAKRTSWDNGDEVVLLAGTYNYSDPAWSGKNCVDVPQNKDFLTIRSASGNPANTILLGRGSETYVSEDLLTTNSPFYARAIYSSKSKIRVRGLTITNFYFNANGVAACGSSANLIDEVSNCVIVGNTGAAGSALANHRVVTDTIFTGNRTTGSGGIFNGNTGFFVTNCLFVSNSAAGSGGVATGISATFVGCTFTNNAAGSESGCFSGNSNNRNMYCEDCRFLGNRANNGGVCKALGGIFTNCVFIGNSATDSCGAINMYASTETCYNCRFENNSADGNYGAANGGNFFDCVFVGNHAGGGSGAISLGTATASGCLFSNNWCVTGNSGALSGANNTHPIVTNCVFVRNHTVLGTGGAIKGVTQVVYDSAFIENSATNQFGGAVDYGGTYHRCLFERNWAKNRGAASSGTFYDCDFIENSAVGDYGAIFATAHGCRFLRNRADGSVGAMRGEAVNCIFIGNTALNNAVASSSTLRGCLVVSNETFGTTSSSLIASSSTPVNCTFVGNRSGGTAILSQNAQNTIFHDNEPCDIANAYVTLKNCIYESSAGNRPTLTDCIQTNNPHFNLGHNPKLAWYAPRKRSPARDAGAEQSWAADSLDLAGNGRLNGPIDIGCYELWPSTDGTKVLLR